MEEVKQYLGALYNYKPVSDEYYGGMSASQVAQFQRTHMKAQLNGGTVQEGVLDQQTLDKMKAAYAYQQRWVGMVKRGHRMTVDGQGWGGFRGLEAGFRQFRAQAIATPQWYDSLRTCSSWQPR